MTNTEIRFMRDLELNKEYKNIKIAGIAVDSIKLYKIKVNEEESPGSKKHEKSMSDRIFLFDITIKGQTFILPFDSFEAKDDFLPIIVKELSEYEQDKLISIFTNAIKKDTTLKGVVQIDENGTIFTDKESLNISQPDVLVYYLPIIFGKYVVAAGRFTTDIGQNLFKNKVINIKPNSIGCLLLDNDGNNIALKTLDNNGFLYTICRKEEPKKGSRAKQITSDFQGIDVISGNDELILKIKTLNIVAKELSNGKLKDMFEKLPPLIDFIGMK